MRRWQLRRSVFGGVVFAAVLPFAFACWGGAAKREPLQAEVRGPDECAVGPMTVGYGFVAMPPGSCGDGPGLRLERGVARPMSARVITERFLRRGCAPGDTAGICNGLWLGARAGTLMRYHDPEREVLVVGLERVAGRVRVSLQASDRQGVLRAFDAVELGSRDIVTLEFWSQRRRYRLMLHAPALPANAGDEVAYLKRCNQEFVAIVPALPRGRGTIELELEGARTTAQAPSSHGR